MAQTIEESMKALEEALKTLAKTTTCSTMDCIERIKTLATMGIDFPIYNVKIEEDSTTKIAEPHRSEDEDSKGDLEIFEPNFERGLRAELNLFEDCIDHNDTNFDLTAYTDCFKIDTEFKI